MTIWVTKYALARGIIRLDGAVLRIVHSAKGERRCALVVRPGMTPLRYWPGEWHEDRASAIRRAEEMRAAALAGLARAADRLASLDFGAAP